MDLGIAGEHALVIGGSEGIGFASARTLLENGAKVTIVSRNPEKLARAADQLETAVGRPVRHFAADITQTYDVAKLTDWLRSDDSDGGPRLDILVSAVGGSQRALFEELTDDAWLANYEFNVLSAVRSIGCWWKWPKRAAHWPVLRVILSMIPKCWKRARNGYSRCGRRRANIRCRWGN